MIEIILFSFLIAIIITVIVTGSCFAVKVKEEIPAIQIVNETPHIKKTHKKYDASKFTQKHYDFIMECYEEFLEYNKIASPNNKKTQQDLAEALNKYTGLDKSVTAYARIWRGQVDRETLAVGTKTFTIQ